MSIPKQEGSFEDFVAASFYAQLTKTVIPSVPIAFIGTARNLYFVLLFCGAASCLSEMAKSRQPALQHFFAAVSPGPRAPSEITALQTDRRLWVAGRRVI